MPRDFKPQAGYIGPCPNCGAIFQHIDSEGNRNMGIEYTNYLSHDAQCTEQAPYLSDPNAFYFQKVNGKYIEPQQCYTETCEY
jgi:hypothetical protein